MPYREAVGNIYHATLNVGSGGGYQLNGGTLEAVLQYIGVNNGTGVFTQTGGINGNVVQPPILYIGTNHSAPIYSGTYNLQGGLLQTGEQLIGSGGAGTFNQSGGTNNPIGGGNLPGDYDNEDGVINIGGNFTNTRGGGTYNLSGGLLQATQAKTANESTENVGNTGTGYFVQTGGTNEANGITVQGNAPKYNGSSYTLSNTGLIITAYENIYGAGANNGIFTQTGGTNTVTYLLQITGGSFTVSAGMLKAAGTIQMDNHGSAGTWNGTFNFNSGTLQAGGALSNQSPITLGTASSSVVTVDANGNAVQLNGSWDMPNALSGPGGLTVMDSAGGGMVVLGTTGTTNLPLNVTNTYSGGTTVLSGTLEVIGAQAVPNIGVLTVAGPGSIVSSAAVGMLFEGATGSASAVGAAGVTRLDAVTEEALAEPVAPSAAAQPLTIATDGGMVPLGIAPAPVPEPGTLALAAIAGLCGTGVLLRRKKI